MAGFGKGTPNKNKQQISRNGAQLLEAAVKAHKAGNIKNAESLYLDAINSGFRHEIAFSNLGLIYENTNRQKEAVSTYKRAISINPKFADAYLNLGNLLQVLGNLDQALASTLKSLEIKPNNPDAHMILGGIYRDLGNLDQALASTLKCLETKPNNPDAQMNLGSIYRDLGNLDQALTSTLKSLALKPDNPTAHMNLGIIYKDLGNLDQALTSTLKSLALKPDNPTAHMNLGIIYKDLGNLGQALASTLRSLDLKPDNPTAQMNLGIIYKDFGNLDQALASTIQSLKLNSNNPHALINLGIIYKELGNLDLALNSTLKSLELKPESPDALTNLGSIYKDLDKLDEALHYTLKSLEIESENPSATYNVNSLISMMFPVNINIDTIKAFDLLLNRTDINHQTLNTLFIQLFLPSIIEASASKPIISNRNSAFKKLASDWRFRKSLTVIKLQSSPIERFLTKLRNEFLTIAIEEGDISQSLKPLVEALAIQCYLNEYVYSTTRQERQSIDRLVATATKSQEAISKYLAIIGCYIPIYTTNLKPEAISKYPIEGTESRDLVITQYEEPCQEIKLQSFFDDNASIRDSTSQLVQGMYEENPYPRYRYSKFTPKKLSRVISKVIKSEIKRNDLVFGEELSSPNAIPKILIAGCGTGDQIILASQYKNAVITAIDLSKTSLAYSLRKVKEYEMNNVTLLKMDLLKVADLDGSFDLIESNGVLHHMHKPYDGLAALVQKLKPGGYMKLGLYSEIGSKLIVKARKIIQDLGISSDSEGIREFRKKVLSGELNELRELAPPGAQDGILKNDFFSLSECRDLCFHVVEHRFTAIEPHELLTSTGLTFSGFMFENEMLDKQIRKLYRDNYPEDENMTLLENWGELEEVYPSISPRLYRFWVCKEA